MTTQPAPVRPAPDTPVRTGHRAPAIGVLGLFLVLAGAGLVVASFLRLDWYVSTSKADSAQGTFRSLRQSVDQFGGAKAAAIYFDWLSWSLLIAVIGFGALANVRTPVTSLMRILGFVAGAAGVGATYYALLQYVDAQAAAGAVRRNPFFNGTWGLFAAFAGYALAGVGAVLGPRSDR